MRKISTISYATRMCMVIFWLVVVVLFLFSPLVSRYFFVEKSITIFTWPMVLDPHALAGFEKKTGIKTYVNYYETNEELYSKLRSTGGRGYDLIIASDYMVEQLIHHQFLKKLDKSKLAFLHTIKPHLLGTYYDPQDAYSLPYYWAIFGLGIDIKYFGGKQPKASWDLLFNTATMNFKVGMTDDGREAVILAGRYLYGSIDDIDRPDRLREIAKLLVQQKKKVELYSDARVEEILVMRECPVMAGPSAEIWKVGQDDEDVKFLIPEEGTFILVEAIVLSAATHKDDYIYQLINYVYQDDVLEAAIRRYGFYSPLTTVNIKEQESLYPNKDQRKKLDFFRNVVSPEHVHDVWMHVLS